MVKVAVDYVESIPTTLSCLTKQYTKFQDFGVGSVARGVITGCPLYETLDRHVLT